ncbi:MAG: Nif3-like dinuclear metal center hexameric protein [Methanomassiliicoccales archaeon]
MLTIADVTKALENKYPLNLAASWDNSGLQVGNSSHQLSKAIIALDCTPSVVNRAEQENAELIITHHPLIFSGLKSIKYDQPLGQMLQRICRSDISVYSLHTNLDRAHGGLNCYLASRLGLMETKVFGELLKQPLFKLVVYVPVDYLQPVRSALGAAGAGHIGEYSHCSFAMAGEGTFLPGSGTHPFLGEVGKLQQVAEYRLESIVNGEQLAPCLAALCSVHPYEEMAYEVYPLQQPVEAYGYGRLGYLSDAMSLKQVAAMVKARLDLSYVRVVGDPEGQLSRLAVVSGSGADLIAEAAAAGAQVLVTGDIKYHEAQAAISHGLALIDAGHDGLERIAITLLAADLREKFADELQIIPHYEELVFALV